MSALDAVLPEGWEVGPYGDSFICPCGDEIEMDGCCPEGHQSPLFDLGMI